MVLDDEHNRATGETPQTITVRAEGSNAPVPGADAPGWQPRCRASAEGAPAGTARPADKGGSGGRAHHGPQPHVRPAGSKLAGETRPPPQADSYLSHRELCGLP